MKPYGVTKREMTEEPFVKKGSYGRYQQTRSKLGYKVQCKAAKSRARMKSKSIIRDEISQNCTEIGGLQNE